MGEVNDNQNFRKKYFYGKQPIIARWDKTKCVQKKDVCGYEFQKAPMPKQEVKSMVNNYISKDNPSQYNASKVSVEFNKNIKNCENDSATFYSGGQNVTKPNLKTKINFYMDFVKDHNVFFGEADKMNSQIIYQKKGKECDVQRKLANNSKSSSPGRVGLNGLDGFDGLDCFDRILSGN